MSPQRPGQKEYQAKRRIKKAQESGGYNEGATCQACVHWLNGCSLKFPEAPKSNFKYAQWCVAWKES